MKIKNIKEKGGGYFEATKEGEEIGRMSYSDAGPDKFVIDHTEVRTKYSGQGVGRSMVYEAVAYARKNDKKIIPMCSFARIVLSRNPEVRDVLFE